jgi:hypothetical protein
LKQEEQCQISQRLGCKAFGVVLEVISEMGWPTLFSDRLHLHCMIDWQSILQGLREKQKISKNGIQAVSPVVKFDCMLVVCMRW